MRKSIKIDLAETDRSSPVRFVTTQPTQALGMLNGSFANEQAAAASNGGAAPPDMSLLAKARGVERGFPQFVFDIFTQYDAGGPDYIHSLLTGYAPAPGIPASRPRRAGGRRASRLRSRRRR